MNHAWDLIVVGAGSAGMSAAIAGAENGARVLLLEAMDTWGGTLHVATGQLSAAGTRLQRELGIEDSPDEHLDDLLRISKGTIDPVLARLAVDHAAEAFDWLMDHGFELADDAPGYGVNHEPYRKPRYYWGPKKALSILEVLDRELRRVVERGDVEVLLHHEVTALLTEPDGAGGEKVVGVTARGSGDLPLGADREAEYRGASVVLTAGGYSANPELAAELNGFPQYAADSYPGCRGAGLRLALSVGGQARGKEHFWCSFGSVLDTYDYPARTLCRPEHRPEVRPPWEIYVNKQGRRFVAEDCPSVDAREAALMAQPDMIRFVIFDERCLREAPPLVPGWSTSELRSRFGAHPMFHAAPDLARLAELIGAPPAELERTVEEYNRALTGTDPLGREHRPVPIAEGPFYAITVHALSVTSTVGVAVDEQLRVTGADGTPIGGLYACGEVLGSGQMQGSAFCGGMLATPAVAFGMLLGRRLAPHSDRA